MWPSKDPDDYAFAPPIERVARVKRLTFIALYLVGVTGTVLTLIDLL
jgi:hypothetical protein